MVPRVLFGCVYRKERLGFGLLLFVVPREVAGGLVAGSLGSFLLRGSKGRVMSSDVYMDL